MSESGHRSCKCGAVYDRSEHIAEAREISSFECAVCGATIENWNSAWVPRYRFIACPARDAELQPIPNPARRRGEREHLLPSEPDKADTYGCDAGDVVDLR